MATLCPSLNPDGDTMKEDEYKSHLRGQIAVAFEDAVHRASMTDDTDTLLQLCSLGGGLIAAEAGSNVITNNPIGFQPNMIPDEEEEEYEYEN